MIQAIIDVTHIMGMAFTQIKTTNYANTTNHPKRTLNDSFNFNEFE